MPIPSPPPPFLDFFLNSGRNCEYLKLCVKGTNNRLKMKWIETLSRELKKTIWFYLKIPRFILNNLNLKSKQGSDGENRHSLIKIWKNTINDKYVDHNSQLYSKNYFQIWVTHNQKRAHASLERCRKIFCPDNLKKNVIFTKTNVKGFVISVLNK